MFKIISPDSVRSGRTCPANLGVRSCSVRKLICPVQSSPKKLIPRQQQNRGLQCQKMDENHQVFETDPDFSKQKSGSRLKGRLTLDKSDFFAY